MLLLLTTESTWTHNCRSWSLNKYFGFGHIQKICSWFQSFEHIRPIVRARIKHKIKDEHEWIVFIIIKYPILICTLKTISIENTHENLECFNQMHQNTVFHNSGETYYHLAKAQHCNNIFPSPSWLNWYCLLLVLEVWVIIQTRGNDTIRCMKEFLILDVIWVHMISSSTYAFWSCSWNFIPKP
jgi:hypothetical protein